MVSLLSTFLWLGSYAAAVLAGPIPRPCANPQSFSRSQRRWPTSATIGSAQLTKPHVTARNFKYVIDVRGGGEDANPKMLPSTTSSQSSPPALTTTDQSSSPHIHGNSSHSLQHKVEVALIAATIVAATITFSLVVLEKPFAIKVSIGMAFFTFLLALDAMGYNALALTIANAATRVGRYKYK